MEPTAEVNVHFSPKQPFVPIIPSHCSPSLAGGKRVQGRDPPHTRVSPRGWPQMISMESRDRDRASHGSPFRTHRVDPQDPVLGLRLLALAAVAGSAAFLPISTLDAPRHRHGNPDRVAIGLVQLVTARRRFPFVGEASRVLAQVAVWTYLARLSGRPAFAVAGGAAARDTARRGTALAPRMRARGRRRNRRVRGLRRAVRWPDRLPAFAIVVGFIAVTTLLARCSSGCSSGSSARSTRVTRR